MGMRTDVLRIKLESDGEGNVKASLAGLEKGFEGVGRKTRDAGGEIFTFANMLKGALVVEAYRAADAMAGLGSESVGAAARLSNLAEITNSSVEELSRLMQAGERNNQSFGDMQNMLRNVGRSMKEAVQDQGGEASQMFRALGVSVTDANGKLRNADAVLLDVAERLSGAEDGTTKMGYAETLLGKNALDAIPALNKMRSEMDEVTRVTKTEFATAADNFGHNVTIMRQSAVQFAQHVLSDVLPALNEWIDRMNVASGAQKELSLGTLEKDRARLVQEYIQAKDSLLKMSDPEAHQRRLQSLLDRIDEVDKKIIESNKRMQGAAKDAAKTQLALPEIKRDKPDAAANDALREHNEMLRDAARIYADTRTPLERYNLEIEHLNKLYAAGAIDADTHTRAVQKQKEILEKESGTAIDNLAARWMNATSQMEAAGVSWAQRSANALTQFAMTGKIDFRSLANSIIADLVRIRTQEMMVRAFSYITSSSSSSGGSDMATTLNQDAAMQNVRVAGTRASGGPVMAGRTYLVGERGPELFTPSASGAITANGAGRGGNKYYIDARGADRQGFAELKRMILSLNGSIEQRSVAAVTNAQRRNQLGGAFG